MSQQQAVCQYLDQLGVSYQLFHHPAVFTVEDVAQHAADVPGLGCKNLFLRDKKGARHFLVVVADDKRVDIQAIGKHHQLGHLSFGSPERLDKYLQLIPGSVSPFGLINDPEGRVEVLIDQDLKQADLLNFHPNDNTATIALSPADFQRFLDSRPNPIQFITIPVL